jgi:hypothetical protein
VFVEVGRTAEGTVVGETVRDKAVGEDVARGGETVGVEFAAVSPQPASINRSNQPTKNTRNRFTRNYLSDQPYNLIRVALYTQGWP